ncbi:Biopolymer transport protein ExbD/TolR [Rubripirellula tenax]|uniref:Biopolymer transport protein ExbD/TolR n=1 Tax=Rubripirellula tenax TaxID=2528015 RepID=A0A5C6EQ20_9BACT|nr:biopolymer transporter ExbD [Rubripirellula tenax]TWU51008.1 Biopolymer transport protein ExbD/TolR [Rubripirellula tenax]
MPIEVVCSQCNASHHVNDRMAGRRVRCPSCDTVVHVPEPEIVLGQPDADQDDLSHVDDALDTGITVDADDAPMVGADSAAIVSEPFVSVASKEAAARSENLAMIPSISGLEDDEEDQVLQRNKRPEEEMDMTPMVDVTFLLLIFFMVTAAFSLQKSIEMPRQQTDAPSTNSEPEETEDLDMVEVQVDEYGSFLVMAPEWERETPGKQNLVSTLKEAAGNNNDGMRLVIKVHEMAKLRALVDAMDAGTIAGYAELEVTQVEEFD